MNSTDLLTQILSIIKIVFILAALWQINKVRNKRIILIMRSGFIGILLYQLFAAGFFFLTLEDMLDVESLIAISTAMTMLYALGAALFAWGFFLVAIDYRKAYEAKSSDVGR